MQTSFIKFTLKYGSFLVAIVSAAIALMALGLTIDSAMTDREYKELMIRPWIGWLIGFGKFSSQLENKGLGPAVIKRWVWNGSGECFDTSKNELENQYEKQDEIISYMKEKLVKDVFREYQRVFSKGGVEPSIDWHFDIPMPGEFIIPGQMKLFLGIEDHVVEKFRSDTINQIYYELANRANSMFVDRIATFPLFIEYCSVSGRYCTGLHDKALGTCRP